MFVTVKPDMAACLMASLQNSKITPIQTGNTIMCVMNCDTVSKIARPWLRDGVNASVTVSDMENHQAVEELQRLGVNTDPCGAAPLAALRRIVTEGSMKLGPDAVVVLISTEGIRPYNEPQQK